MIVKHINNKFIRYLAMHNTLIEFNKGGCDIQKSINTIKHSELGGAFTWGETAQGHNFWEKVDESENNSEILYQLERSEFEEELSDKQLTSRLRILLHALRDAVSPQEYLELLQYLFQKDDLIILPEFTSYELFRPSENYGKLSKLIIST